MITLSEKLKSLGISLGFSNAEAAKRCGLDRRRYGHYVTGRSRPNYETLLKLCDALGTSPNLLLDYNEQGKSTDIQQLVATCHALSSEQITFLLATAQTLQKQNM
jgi:transcriptional regulator with XRE-family HTH domain